MLYRFGEFTFDTDRRELHRGADAISIAPQVFDLLEYLIRNRERVVTKDDLVSAIWNGRVVSDAAITTRLNAVRNAVGDSGEEHRFIKTLPRKGFRFVAAIVEAGGFADASGCDTSPQTAMSVLPLPDRPSVAVLPFTNLSSDPEQEYFADGMTEDIITALSRFKELFVIARHSSFTYKRRAIDVKHVGTELGVRYVLEGSVRKVADRVRITGQLADTISGVHLWSNRFDGGLSDVFDLQDRVTESVVGAIAPTVEKAEIERAKRKPTGSLDAYTLYLRGLASSYQDMSQQSNDEALRLFNRATELDPGFAAAYGRAAACYAYGRGVGWTPGAVDEIAEVTRLTKRAIALGQDDAIALASSGWALAYIVRDFDQAVALVDRSLFLNSNLAEAWHSSGWIKDWLLEPIPAIACFERAMRLNPLGPRVRGMRTGIAYAHFLLGRYDEAASWAARALQEAPDFPAALRVTAASNAMAGRTEQARKAVVRLQQILPALRVSSLRRTMPHRRVEDLAPYEEALRRAGLPD